MITTTVRKVIDETVEENMEGYFLYLVSDKDVHFYAGRSLDPINRIHQHLAIPGNSRPHMHSSALGYLIKDNMPESYDWTVTFFAIEDFQMYDVPLHNRDYVINNLETALIQVMKPCLNAMKRNYHNPLPDRYEKQKIANEGVKL